jgi:hypothetical protein
MVRTQIYLPQQLHTDLKLLAKQEEESVAAIVRRIIFEGMREIRKKSGSPAKVLLKIAGMGGKTRTPKDLSANLIKYLYGEKSTYARRTK